MVADLLPIEMRRARFASDAPPPSLTIAGSAPRAVRSLEDKRRLTGKQPVCYSIPKDPDHHINVNLHRIIARTICDWNTQRRQRLLPGLAGSCEPVDRKSQRLHKWLARTNMSRKKKAAWLAEQISLALGGSQFVDQKRRWDQLAKQAQSRKARRKSGRHAPSDQRGPRACHQEMQQNANSARQSPRDRPAPPIISHNDRAEPERTRLRRKQPVPYGIPKDPDSTVSTNLHRIIAHTVCTWDAKQRRKLFRGIRGICAPTDEKIQRLHTSMETTNMCREAKAAWIADEIGQTIGGTIFIDQKERWDRIALEATRRPARQAVRLKLDVCQICATKYPAQTCNAGQHRCAACLREFRIDSKAHRSNHRQRPTLPLVCPVCNDTGYTPHDLRAYQCQVCHQLFGRRSFSSAAIRNFIKRARGTVICVRCTGQDRTT